MFDCYEVSQGFEKVEIMKSCITHRALMCAVQIAVTLLCSNAFGQGATANASSLSPIKSFTVIEEIVHPVRHQSFNPPVVVPTDSDGRATAEAAVIAYINAMRRNDYAGAYAIWDQESQRAIADDESKRGISREKRTDDWKRLFGGHQVVLANRLEYASYVLIEYRVQTADGKIVAEETVVTKKTPTGFVLTIELASSAVLQGWKSPASRVQRLAPHAYQRLQIVR
jgi:hypothetical protein